MTATKEGEPNFVKQITLFLGFILVVMGMANNLPNVPGLVEAVRFIPGLEELPRLSKYNPEYFFPLSFVFMVTISLLGASLTQRWWNWLNLMMP